MWKQTVARTTHKSDTQWFDVTNPFWYCNSPRLPPPPPRKFFFVLNKVKVKWSRYRPGVAQRVGRGTALLFHDRGTRRGWVVSCTPRPHFTTGKDPVPVLQEAGWAPGPVWTGEKSRLHQDSIPDRPACNQLLYQLSYRAHTFCS